MNGEFLENLWKLVLLTNNKILVVNMMGDYRAFIVENFATKTRDNPFNEVRGAVDITKDTKNLVFQMSELNPVGIEVRLQGRPRWDFKFGGDDYFWLISNRKNEY